MKHRAVWTCLFLFIFCSLFSAESWARREILTQEQKDRLDKIDRVLVEVIAITDKGTSDPAPLTEIVVRRLKEIGYTVLIDTNQPSDIVFKVKCEQRKVWEGTSASGGDADLPDSPSRVWKGPACQITYLLDGKTTGWRKEVRTEFQDAGQAAEAVKAGDPSAFALAKLQERLELYDFPVLLTAEWGQEGRLLKVLDAPATTPVRKVLIIRVLGESFAAEAVPRLLTALKDPDIEVAKAAAIALGNIGKKDSIPALVEVLKTGKPELQTAAAKGLGLLGTLHADFSIIQPLLEALNSPDINVKTEVAWALGKLPDKRAYEPLYTLSKSLQRIHNPNPDEKKLKEAVNYSLKQIDTWEYIQ
jgi:hypothetical protein